MIELFSRSMTCDQPEDAGRFIKFVDATRAGSGKLHCLGDNRGQHCFAIERGVHRLADLTERL